jgi:hypothetical protein
VVFPLKPQTAAQTRKGKMRWANAKGREMDHFFNVWERFMSNSVRFIFVSVCACAALLQGCGTVKDVSEKRCNQYLLNSDQYQYCRQEVRKVFDELERKQKAADDTSKQPLPGSDRDAHGCIGSAGYQWDESQKKCARPWENTPVK